ncbi:TonB-dependent receptor plug domain-containing protein, partial [Escherichia coli]|uniref:TonB-dependent receptor plug domain-containing protein n=1 Tax=Escherichia coli TaxID=562 RepID=UPI00202034DB
MENIGDIPVTNASRLLQGQAAGVLVRQNNGRPGQELEVQVRGLGSLGAGSKPLYVIDGFPVGTSIGHHLNPNDIESMTVLK